MKIYPKKLYKLNLPGDIENKIFVILIILTCCIPIMGVIKSICNENIKVKICFNIEKIM